MMEFSWRAENCVKRDRGPSVDYRFTTGQSLLRRSVFQLVCPAKPPASGDRDSATKTRRLKEGAPNPRRQIRTPNAANQQHFALFHQPFLSLASFCYIRPLSTRCSSFPGRASYCGRSGCSSLDPSRLSRLFQLALVGPSSLPRRIFAGQSRRGGLPLSIIL